MTRVLVTGFGPFPGVRANPSAALARRLARDICLKRSGFLVSLHLFPTTYAAADADVPVLVAQRPDAVLMLGVASKRKALTPERRARNRLAQFPDASGQRPLRRVIQPGGPAMRPARAPIERIVTTGRGHGVPVRASMSAGSYLCNYAYWQMLAALPAATPCLFVHVPGLKRHRLASATHALAAMLRLLARRPVSANHPC